MQKKQDTRKCFDLVVNGYIHTIVMQDRFNPKPWMQGNYMGHKGYVLKGVTKIKRA